MNYSNFENSIFIVKDAAKENVIKKIHNEKLLNIKVITLEELRKKYYFEYSNKAIYEVSKKYNIIGQIAKIYIENIYYIKDIDNEKVKLLKEMKDFLIEKNLLTYNKFFRSFLKNKKIVLVDLDDVDTFYKHIFDELKEHSEIIKINTLNNSTIKPIYKAKNKEEEIAFVACSICDLIKKGIDINRIRLANVQSDYTFAIEKIFNFFNIPVTLPSMRATGSIIVDKFIELYDNDINTCFQELNNYVKSTNDKKIYDNLIQIVNQYAWCDNYNDVKELILSDIQDIKLPKEKLKNSVTTIDFENDILDNNDYIYLINFNQGIIPVSAKDEDYFDNKIKKLLGISDSIEINELRINNVKNRIRGSKNLIVTYSESDLSGKLYISNAYDENDFNEYNCEIDYTKSNAYNKLKLVSAQDEFKKFGTINEYLPILSSNYKDLLYKSYDNAYSEIDKTKMYKYLNQKLTLSYSSVDTYYKCAFRYYLENILKISEFENRIETIIGNIFHKVLSKCYNENFNLDKEYEIACNDEDYNFDIREKHFIDKLKLDLVKIIDIIKIQDNYTELKNKLFEKRVVVPIDTKNNVEFKGFIDKIMYQSFDDKIIATIIDYKTGNTNINLKNVEFGLSMQLPAYAYLIRNILEFKNATIGGFYLQKLFDEEDLKLNGDINILAKVDNTYKNSNLINGIKVGQNGLYQNAKILTDNEIDDLCNLVESKIKEAALNILCAKFSINPKEINNENIGCKYCKYKSICYMKNDDIIKLGGDSNAEMD